MGQCYSVEIKARFRDEDGAKKALQAKLGRHEEEYVNYDIGAGKPTVSTVG